MIAVGRDITTENSLGRSSWHTSERQPDDCYFSERGHLVVVEGGKCTDIDLVSKIPRRLPLPSDFIGPLTRVILFGEERHGACAFVGNDVTVYKWSDIEENGNKKAACENVNNGGFSPVSTMEKNTIKILENRLINFSRDEIVWVEANRLQRRNCLSKTEGSIIDVWIGDYGVYSLEGEGKRAHVVSSMVNNRQIGRPESYRAVDEGEASWDRIYLPKHRKTEEMVYLSGSDECGVLIIQAFATGKGGLLLPRMRWSSKWNTNAEIQHVEYCSNRDLFTIKTAENVIGVHVDRTAMRMTTYSNEPLQELQKGSCPLFSIAPNGEHMAFSNDKGLWVVKTNDAVPRDNKDIKREWEDIRGCFLVDADPLSRHSSGEINIFKRSILSEISENLYNICGNMGSSVSRNREYERAMRTYPVKNRGMELFALDGKNKLKMDLFMATLWDPEIRCVVVYFGSFVVGVAKISTKRKDGQYANYLDMGGDNLIIVDYRVFGHVISSLADLCSNMGISALNPGLFVVNASKDHLTFFSNNGAMVSAEKRCAQIKSRTSPCDKKTLEYIRRVYSNPDRTKILGKRPIDLIRPDIATDLTWGDTMTLELSNFGISLVPIDPITQDSKMTFSHLLDCLEVTDSSHSEYTTIYFTL